jgi:membrane AbrB-like protein
VLSLIVFFALGIAGCFVGERLKFPAPAILGPLLFLGIAGFWGLPISPPSWLRPLLSVILGVILGLRCNVASIGMARELALTALWLTALTSLAALALIPLGIDKTTAVFAAAPGGITEIALTAMSFGAHAFTVAILQLSRMLFTLILIPFLVRLKCAASQKAKKNQAAPDGSAVSPGAPQWIALAALGLFSAGLFSAIGIPASNLTGPMLAVGAYTRIRKRSFRIHKNLQKIAQIGVGGLIGLSVTRESILSFPSYILPILCLNVIMVGGCCVLALVLFKLTGWDMTTCLIAAAPGGLSPMILLSIEMGADSNRVVLFQVLRITLALLLTPFLGSFFLRR